MSSLTRARFYVLVGEEAGVTFLRNRAAFITTLLPYCSRLPRAHIFHSSKIYTQLEHKGKPSAPHSSVDQAATQRVMGCLFPTHQSRDVQISVLPRSSQPCRRQRPRRRHRRHRSISPPRSQLARDNAASRRQCGRRGRRAASTKR